MTAMMLGGGYTLSATGPFVLGLLRDTAGSFTLSMWLLFAISVVVLLIVLLNSPDQLRRSPRRQATADSTRSAVGVS
jgi:cyanate permease